MTTTRELLAIQFKRKTFSRSLATLRFVLEEIMSVDLKNLHQAISLLIRSQLYIDISNYCMSIPNCIKLLYFIYSVLYRYRFSTTVRWFGLNLSTTLHAENKWIQSRRVCRVVGGIIDEWHNTGWSLTTRCVSWLRSLPSVWFLV